MDELEELFEKAINENIKKHVSFADSVIMQAEEEFKGYNNLSEAQLSRNKEKIKSNEKIKLLRRKLHRYRNVKNTKLSNINKKCSEKRKNIKIEIESHKLKLQEIENEEQGSKINPSEKSK